MELEGFSSLSGGEWEDGSSRCRWDGDLSTDLDETRERESKWSQVAIKASIDFALIKWLLKDVIDLNKEK